MGYHTTALRSTTIFQQRVYIMDHDGLHAAFANVGLGGFCDPNPKSTHFGVEVNFLPTLSKWQFGNHARIQCFYDQLLKPHFLTLQP